ncbi:MAG: cobalt ECF transporter T component CbiQ [Desulfovibrio sp.]|nr:cobalt ECF transporter T component CbiQ [Desulfovibrio sp.]
MNIDDASFVRPSPIGRLDPRVRFLLAIAATVSIALFRDPLACALALCLGAILALAARLPPGTILRRLALVNVFVLFVWCVTPFTTPGDIAFQWHGIAVTRQGLYLATLIALKTNAIFLVFCALICSMLPSTAVQVLERFHCPEKLVLLFLCCVRYIHVLADEWENLWVAARLRGFEPGTNRHTYRTIASLLGLLLVRSYDRAGRVWEAMRLRGFNGRFGGMATFDAGVADIAFGIALACALAALWLVNAGAPWGPADPPLSWGRELFPGWNRG